MGYFLPKIRHETVTGLQLLHLRTLKLAQKERGRSLKFLRRQVCECATACACVIVCAHASLCVRAHACGGMCVHGCLRECGHVCESTCVLECVCRHVCVS